VPFWSQQRFRYSQVALIASLRAACEPLRLEWRRVGTGDRRSAPWLVVAICSWSVAGWPPVGWDYAGALVNGSLRGGRLLGWRLTFAGCRGGGISAESGRTPIHGYEATHEAEMVAFAKSWLRK
jgi:hypothetical protein